MLKGGTPGTLGILSPVSYSLMSKGQRIKLIRILGGIFAVVLALAVTFSFTPVFVIETEQKVYRWMFAGEGAEFSLEFIHSVHLSPVTENFVITSRQSFVLQSAEYQSFGVGMPFLQEEGKFRHSGNKFIMSDMNREFKTIELRIYPENKLTMTYEGVPDYLYEKLPYASLVRFRACFLGPYIIDRIF